MRQQDLAPCSLRHKQRGSALVVVLLLLLVTMLMATASLRLANAEERMAANQRDRQLAFQVAEAALRDAELTISAATAEPFRPLRPTLFTAACTNGLCRSAPDAPVWTSFSAADWSSAKTWAYGSATGTPVPAGVQAAPRFAIEYQGTLQPVEPGKPCVAIFLITARATGATAASEVILQTVYRHRAGDCYAGV